MTVSHPPRGKQERPHRRLKGYVKAEVISLHGTEAAVPGRTLVYQKYGAGPTAYPLLESPGIKPWSTWTVPMSMREVEPGVNLVMEDDRSNQDPVWRPRPTPEDDATDVEKTP